MEQRINLKFLCKLSKSPAESHAMLKQVYGDDSMILKTVYWDVLKLLLARIRHVQPHLKQPGSLFLLHNNAWPHTAMLVKQFLAQRGVTEILHRPYSQDLAPPEFLPFTALKVAL
ncbi:hypothetical protein AVEN_175625-1 [Araneus ventricosus]|uniref:Mariner Mos1 transposase n=1 Tax=Araneus ventricosus TaxID=182803 RepID=A0A4Y2LRY0_ARAVE|nr:hypothetical protein AVEN_175625-1 [Araneus ventricosus]